MTFEPEKQTNEDARTMEELRKIANTIYECVQFTTDCLSSHWEGRVPVLDLQMFIGDDGLIKYHFYENDNVPASL